MTNGGYQNFNEIYQKLPEEVKEAIFSVDTSDAIEEISKKYNLTIDKMGILADEIGKIMMGLDHPRNFISNLSESLRVDKETARKIAEDVNSQIFSKIREALRKIHKIEAEDREEKRLEEERQEVLKEIEKEEQEERAEIKKEEEKNDFEKKIANEIQRKPPNVSEYYPEGDPYREPIE